MEEIPLTNNYHPKKMVKRINYEESVNLIQAVSLRRPLWDKKTNFCKKFQSKQLLWKDIAYELYGDYNKVMDAKQKWARIRNEYTKAKKHGMNYKFGNFLTFLDEVIVLSNSKNNGDMNEKMVIQEILDDYKNMQTTYKQDNDKSMTTFDDLMNNQCEHDYTNNNMENLNSECFETTIAQKDDFGNFIDHLLNDLPETIRYDLKIKILSIVIEAQLKLRMLPLSTLVEDNPNSKQESFIYEFDK